MQGTSGLHYNERLPLFLRVATVKFLVKNMLLWRLNSDLVCQFKKIKCWCTILITSFFSIIMDGWRIINIVLFLQYITGSLKQWLNWRNKFISSPTKVSRCISGDFTGFDFPEYHIFYRTTYSVRFRSGSCSRTIAW